MVQAGFRNKGGNADTTTANVMEQIVSGKATLLVGSEAMLRRNMPGTQGTGDSMFLVYNIIADGTRKISSNEDERPQTDHEWQLLLSEKALCHSDQCEEAWNEIVNKYSDLQEYIEPTLKALIETKAFRVVMTTCITRELEYLMRKVWGKNLVAYDFSDVEDIRQFAEKWQKSETEKCASLEPSLIYLYHPCDIDGATTFSEDDFIKGLDLFRQKSFSGSAIQEFFKKFLYERNLIAVGCHYDEWRFRFFWYTLRTGFQYDNKKVIEKDTVVYTSTENDRNLGRYLQCAKKSNTKFAKFDSRTFMDSLTKMLTSEDNWKSLLEARVASSDAVFLSYASEDFSLAWDLYKKLQASKIKVWMDHSDLYPGDEYYYNIERAIKACGVFVPILSSQMKIDLTALMSAEQLPKSEEIKRNEIMRKHERYYMKEWGMALSNRKMILPVMAGDYSTDDDYHMEFRRRCGMADENEKQDRNVEHINSNRIVDKLSEILLNH